MSKNGGAPVPTNFTVTVEPGVDSPVLWLDVAKGTHLQQATLTLHENGDTIQWLLKDVTVTSFHTAEGADTITLSFRSAQETVTPPHGKPVTASQAGSDMAGTFGNEVAGTQRVNENS